MSNHPESSINAAKSPHSAPASGVVCQLIRQLVSATVGSGCTLQVAADAEDAEEVLLDIDVDGRRYMLLRLPRQSNRPTLSPREHEIARMVAAGYASKTIAAVLNISLWTVGTHLRRIFAKLGVNTRAAMVARLHDTGVDANSRVSVAEATRPANAPIQIGAHQAKQVGRMRA